MTYTPAEEAFISSLTTTELFLYNNTLTFILENHSEYPLTPAQFFTYIHKSTAHNSLTLDIYATIALIYALDFETFVNKSISHLSEDNRKFYCDWTLLIVGRYLTTSFASLINKHKLSFLFTKISTHFSYIRTFVLNPNPNLYLSLIVDKFSSVFLTSSLEALDPMAPPNDIFNLFEMKLSFFSCVKTIIEENDSDDVERITTYCTVFTRLLFHFDFYFPKSNNPFLNLFNSHTDTFLVSFYKQFCNINSSLICGRSIPRNHKYFKILFQNPIMTAQAFKNNHQFFLKQSYCDTKLALTTAPQHFLF